MFDIWREIEERGAVVVPVKETALSALGWTEIGEKYPELMPECFRRYDVYNDPMLIRESPFKAVEDGDGRSYRFVADDPATGVSLVNVSVDVDELLRVLPLDEFMASDAESTFGGVLVCSCGIAGCAGIWSQTCHVSEKMVHWSVRKYEDEIELFFEREVYERGVMKMLREMVERPGAFSVPHGQLYNDDHEQFVSNVMAMLKRCSYYQERWEEIA